MQGTERHFALLIDNQIFQQVFRAAFGAKPTRDAEPFGIARISIWFLFFEFQERTKNFLAL
ncbi:hypothetical protein IB265_32485 [Ensifer sp. ENS10]|uniref:hypothetical protein n=1 Tax=unclassified Ensifer TaxID=2633371 RepID=UPI0013B02B44|nr:MULTISPECIES: hypothetical protein [unclassified Ensifer]MBD9511478.1 hypothetical protein [Ensifer sp. ENS10]MBV7522189.1 hypothetical protein [Ensifer sp. ENS12]